MVATVEDIDKLTTTEDHEGTAKGTTRLEEHRRVRCPN